MLIWYLKDEEYQWWQWHLSPASPKTGPLALWGRSKPWATVYNWQVWIACQTHFPLWHHSALWLRVWVESTCLMWPVLPGCGLGFEPFPSLVCCTNFWRSLDYLHPFYLPIPEATVAWATILCFTPKAVVHFWGTERHCCKLQKLEQVPTFLLLAFLQNHVK